MARPGDPESRPSETFAVTGSSTDMEEELERLSTHAVVVWLGRDRPDVDTDRVSRAFCYEFGVYPNDISMARHHPADFVVIFTRRHHRDAAVERRDFLYGDLDFHIRRWLPMIQGRKADLSYHVCLCLEGLPLHAWNESIAKRTVARSCDLDYVEEESLRKKDTRNLNLWAWTEDPSCIPKATWLTIVGRSLVVHEGGSPSAVHSGSNYHVIVHLDLVEEPLVLRLSVDVGQRRQRARPKRPS
ncbi:hypothetical protein BS78_K026300 [Paspalum vaginatum]|uniref:DUF4283 domain-containing protein n=1 Tax=Paspalum vaginatum TaxID=158149 RepID=A0A9W7XDS2_9POAL|nr:hypothetical protein BS78_K026300 [Paspalum vaginatum]